MCNPIYVGKCSLWLQREGEETEGRAGGRGGGPLPPFVPLLLRSFSSPHSRLRAQEYRRCRPGLRAPGSVGTGSATPREGDTDPQECVNIISLPGRLLRALQ